MLTASIRAGIIEFIIEEIVYSCITNFPSQYFIISIWNISTPIATGNTCTTPANNPMTQ